VVTGHEGPHERSEDPPSLRSLHPGTGEPETGEPSRWLGAVDGWPQVRVHALVGAVLAALVLLHASTDWTVVSALYLLPVALASWALGRARGLLWAALTAAGGLTGHMAAQGAPLATALGRAVPWLAIFAAFALAVSALRREREAVRALQGTDRLTGVRDAGSFRALVELERNRALRYNRPFTLAYMDVDGLRLVNWEQGHSAGDEVLRLVAASIRDTIRSMDSVARVGGDEFALLLPETGRDAADVALRKVLARLTEAMAARSLETTCTVGGVICIGAPESVDRLIQRAETLMYAAKEEGGGRIRTEVLDENFGIEAILQRS